MKVLLQGNTTSPHGPYEVWAIDVLHEFNKLRQYCKMELISKIEYSIEGDCSLKFDCMNQEFRVIVD